MTLTSGTSPRPRLSAHCNGFFAAVLKVNRLAREPRATQPDPQTVKRDLEARLAQVEHLAAAHERTRDAFAHARPGLEFFADSLLARSAWRHADAWKRDALQGDITHHCPGDEFFWVLFDEAYKRSRAGDESAGEALEVLYIAAGLGFTGVLEDAPERIRSKLGAAFAELRDKYQRAGGKLCPESYRADLTEYNRPFPLGKWLLAGALALVSLIAAGVIASFVVSASFGELTAHITFLADTAASPVKSGALAVAGLGAAVAIGAIGLCVGAYFLLRRAKNQFDDLRLRGGVKRAAGHKGGSEAENRQLAVKFLEGIDVFKQSGRSLLRDPWYLLIGSSGTGKTEAVRKAKLDCPQGLHDEIQGFGGTLSMDWWFTLGGIIIDTAGRLVEDNARAQRDWRNLLDLLKRHRPHRPINGVILVIPAARPPVENAATNVHPGLLHETPDQMHARLEQYREKLRDVSDRLGVRVPVWVVVTMCDRILGFREFFGNLGNVDEQGQILGWSDERSIDEGFDPELVDDAVENIAESLRMFRLQLLREPGGGGASRTNAADALFGFPDRFAQLKSSLGVYLRGLFADGGQKGVRPFLRGVYFTSAMEKHGALDDEVAEWCGGTPAHILAHRAHARDRTLFLTDLFDQKIFRESGLVTPSRRAVARRATLVWTARLAYAAAGLVMAASLLTTWAAVHRWRSDHLAAFSQTAALIQARESGEDLGDAAADQLPLAEMAKAIREAGGDLSFDDTVEGGVFLISGGSGEAERGSSDAPSESGARAGATIDAADLHRAFFGALGYELHQTLIGPARGAVVAALPEGVLAGDAPEFTERMAKLGALTALEQAANAESPEEAIGALSMGQLVQPIDGLPGAGEVAARLEALLPEPAGDWRSQTVAEFFGMVLGPSEPPSGLDRLLAVALAGGKVAEEGAALRADGDGIDRWRGDLAEFRDRVDEKLLGPCRTTAEAYAACAAQLAPITQLENDLLRLTGAEAEAPIELDALLEKLEALKAAFEGFESPRTELGVAAAIETLDGLDKMRRRLSDAADRPDDGAKKAQELRETLEKLRDEWSQGGDTAQRLLRGEEATWANSMYGRPLEAAQLARKATAADAAAAANALDELIESLRSEPDDQTSLERALLVAVRARAEELLKGVDGRIEAEGQAVVEALTSKAHRVSEEEIQDLADYAHRFPDGGGLEVLKGLPARISEEMKRDAGIAISNAETKLGALEGSGSELLDAAHAELELIRAAAERSDVIDALAAALGRFELACDVAGPAWRNQVSPAFDSRLERVIEALANDEGAAWLLKVCQEESRAECVTPSGLTTVEGRLEIILLQAALDRDERPGADALARAQAFHAAVSTMHPFSADPEQPLDLDMLEEKWAEVESALRSAKSVGGLKAPSAQAAPQGPRQKETQQRVLKQISDELNRYQDIDRIVPGGPRRLIEALLAFRRKHGDAWRQAPVQVRISDRDNTGEVEFIDLVDPGRINPSNLPAAPQRQEVRDVTIGFASAFAIAAADKTRTPKPPFGFPAGVLQLVEARGPRFVGGAFECEFYGIEFAFTIEGLGDLPVPGQWRLPRLPGE